MALTGRDVQKRLQAVISASDVSQNLSDVTIPVFVNNSSGKTTFDASLLFEELSGKEDWKYIAFEYGDTGQKCFAELEVWEPENKKAVFHVNIPDISGSANTDLFLYYGKDFIDNTEVQNKYQTYLNTELSCKDISDDFTGNDGDSPNADLWITLRDLWAAGYTCIPGEIESDKLKIADSSAFIGGVQSLFYIYGDFDIQSDCDFTNLDDWSYIYAWNSSADRAYIGFNSGQYVRIGSIVSSVSDYTNTGAVQPTSIRMVRKGSVLTGYYSTGAGWVEIDSLSCHTEGFFIAIVTQTSTSNKGSYYDNFIVNSADKIVNYAPIKDEFSGTDGDSPDNTLWNVYNSTASGTVDIQSNKLHINIPVSANDESIALVSKNILPNSSDFDIKVDFSSLVSTQPTSSYSYPIQLRLTDIITGVNGFVCIQHAYNNSTRRYYYDGSLWNSSNLIGINDTSGKIRLVKSGSTITFYYWNNSSSRWEWNGNVAGSSTTLQSTNDLEFRLHFTADFGGGTVIDVDDFIEISYDPIFSADPFSDNFDNSDLWIGEDDNWKLWFPAWPWDSSYSIVNNELLITPSTTSDIGGVTSRGKLLSGDFHVKVDAEPTNSGGGSYFHLVIDNENRCYVGYNQGTGKWEGSYTVSNTATTTASTQTGIAKKTLEIIRSGSSLVIICADEVIVTATFVTGDCYVGFGANYYQSKFSAFEVLFGNIFTYPTVVDGFTGNDGDLPRKDLWKIYSGSPVISSNNLSIGNASSGAGVNHRIISKFTFPAGKDFRVDMEYSNFSQIGGNGDSCIIQLIGNVVGTDNTDYVRAYHQITSAQNAINGSVKVGGTNYAGSDIAVAGTSYKFRVEKVGNIYTAYYDAGSGWVTLHSRTDATLSAYDFEVHIQAQNWANNIDFNALVDSIAVVYADEVTGYIGETGSRQAQNAWKLNTAFASLMAQDPSGAAPQILDSTQNESDGTSYGTMTSDDLIDGTTGKLIEFDGTDDYINYGYKAAHDITDVLTVEALIKPTTILDSGLSDYVGIVSRQMDPTDTEDTYTLFINLDGKVQGGSQGGNLQSTTASFAADKEFLIVFTYTSSGYTGDIFIYNLTDGSGGKEVLTNDTLESMTGSTNNLVVGKHADSGQFFPGSIGFVRISNEVKSDTEIEVNAKAWMDDLFTVSQFVLQSTLYIDFVQPFAMVDKFQTDFIQRYGISAGSIILDFLQYYSIQVLVEFIQKYGDSKQFVTEFLQPYSNKQAMIMDFIQRYGISPTHLIEFIQEYNGTTKYTVDFTQVYSIAENSTVIDFVQNYSINETNRMLVEFIQPYKFAGNSIISTVDINVYVNGIAIDFASVNGLRFSNKSYAGQCSIVINKKNVFDSIKVEDSIVVDALGTAFVFVVTSKTDSGAVGKTDYIIECMSPAVLMDFPYASVIPEDFNCNGKASKIVENLANLCNINITWNCLSDPVLTEDDVQIDNNSPLSAIRGIVNELGFKVHSSYSGDVIIESNYPVDSDKLDTNPTPYRTFYEGSDFSEIQTVTEKKSGYNKVSIDETNTATGYNLSPEEITPSRFKIKASKVPWSDRAVVLVTSEKTNAYITSKGLTLETITEENVEIHNGSGSLQNPCYSIKSIDYGTRTNLGGITFAEDGTITSSVTGDTLVNIVYVTKYWEWELYGTDREAVQASLEYA